MTMLERNRRYAGLPSSAMADMLPPPRQRITRFPGSSSTRPDVLPRPLPSPTLHSVPARREKDPLDAPLPLKPPPDPTDARPTLAPPWVALLTAWLGLVTLIGFLLVPLL